MMTPYRRVYNAVGFSIFGLALGIVSVMLAPGLGVRGVLMPWVLVGIGYMFVSMVLDIVILILEKRQGARPPVEPDEF
jgi:hypothetical protein